MKRNTYYTPFFIGEDENDNKTTVNITISDDDVDNNGKTDEIKSVKMEEHEDENGKEVITLEEKYVEKSSTESPNRGVSRGTIIYGTIGTIFVVLCLCCCAFFFILFIAALAS